MDIKIDDIKLYKLDITLPEVLTMKVLQEHGSFPNILESLQKAEFISGYNYDDNVTSIGLTKTGEMILDRLTEEVQPVEEPSENDERLEQIANAMREIYPKGFKRDDYGNEVYPWRGSASMLKDRLRKFEKLFGKTLDYEDTIEATKRYVDLQTKKDPVLRKDMRLLKYFIFKNDEKQGLISDLLDYLETEVGEEVYDDSNGMTIL